MGYHTWQSLHFTNSSVQVSVDKSCVKFHKTVKFGGIKTHKTEKQLWHKKCHIAYFSFFILFYFFNMN